MSKDTLLVRQPFGIGDILFVSPIVRKLDYNIIWPVESHYLWIKEYVKQDNIEFVDASSFSSFDSEIEVVNFLDAERILRNLGNQIDCMTAKYVYANHDIEDWKKLYWERNLKKEYSLMESLGIKEGDSYNLINLNFAEPRLGYKINFTINNEFKNIYMDYREGYTLLDWGKVIENSREFHTVSTSTFYMVEFLKDTPTLHLYPRYGLDVNLDPIRPIISERWICHE